MHVIRFDIGLWRSVPERVGSECRATFMRAAGQEIIPFMQQQITDVLGTISTRELAIIIWLGLALIAMLCSKSVRRSASSLVRALSAKYVAANILILIIGVCLSVWLLKKAGLWNYLLIKTTVVWFFTVATTAFFKLSDISSFSFFMRVMRSKLSLAVLMPFVISSYTFSLWIELIIVLFLLFFTAMAAISKSYQKPEYALVLKFSNAIIVVIAIVYIAYGMFEFLSDPSLVVSVLRLKELILPIPLTIMTIPIIYMQALYLNYQSIFLCFNATATHGQERRKLKKVVIFSCGFAVSKVYRVRKNLNWLYPPSLSDISRYASG